MINTEDRKLVHIEKIIKLEPIEGADRIEKATILGWEVVVKKGEFKEGELVCYFEIDYLLPEKPEFEFMRERKFRVRTIKLRKQVSQGLCLPISILPYKEYKEGDDVTELLGVTKYLTPCEKAERERVVQKANKLQKFMMRYSWFRRLFLSRAKVNGFPYWICKTDEPRLQSMPQVIEQFKDKVVYITEKIDYQSVTFTGKIMPKFGGLLGRLIPIKKYRFVVCSRNFTTNDQNSLYWKVARKYKIEEILKENPHITIQGEQGDPSVQGNKYGLKEPRLWIFNIVDHEKNWLYNWQEMKDFCEKYNLETVPLIDIDIKLSSLGENVQDFVTYSQGQSVIAPIMREGIVVRCVENGQKTLSFKVINPDFLLKYDN